MNARSGTLQTQRDRWEAMKSACTITDLDWKKWMEGDMEPLNKVTDGLLLMKKAAVESKIASTTVELNSMIDKVLSDYQSNENGPVFISMLTRELRSKMSGLANKMIDEHNAFQGEQTAIKNRAMGKTIADLLKAMTGTDYSPTGPECARLNIQSEKFKMEYCKLRDPLLNDNLSEDKVDRLIIIMITKCQKVAACSDLSRADQIRSLMAHIFACLTIDKSRMEYVAHKKAGDQKMAEEYLLQPHSGQILALFRIFGLDEESSESKSDVKPAGLMQIVKSVVEIGTGEGKSVTLAATAMILALLGYEVNIVCYSEYLTDRDRASFSKFFQRFSLQDSIKYGTFKDVCEDFLNNRGDIRDAVISAMSSGRGSPQASVSSSAAANSDRQEAAEQHVPARRILLIDEVDVFFRDDFFKVELS